MGWERFYEYVKSIPRGRVTTYAEVARVAKLRGGAREAGHAMASMPHGQGIPWHRVVGYGGKLLIREPHRSLQRKLLVAEKVEVAGASLDYEKYGWVPRKRRTRGKAKKKVNRGVQTRSKKRARGRRGGTKV